MKSLKFGAERVRTDRIRILDPGFYDEKLEKYTLKITELLKQPVSLHREHPALRNMKYLFLSVCVIVGLS